MQNMDNSVARYDIVSAEERSVQWGRERKKFEILFIDFIFGAKKKYGLFSDIIRRGCLAQRNVQH